MDTKWGSHHGNNYFLEQWWTYERSLPSPNKLSREYKGKNAFHSSDIFTPPSTLSQSAPSEKMDANDCRPEQWFNSFK